MKRTFACLLLLALVASFPSGARAAAWQPNDQDIPFQSYLSQISAFSAWQRVGGGSSAVTVALIDTGVDTDHPDLASSLWTNAGEKPGNGIDDDDNGYVDDVHGWNFTNETPNVKAQFENASYAGINHGTVLAGIIAAEANNFVGSAGIAYGVKIMPLLALDNRGMGTSDGAVRAIEYAIAQHADVINLSVVGKEYSPSLDVAIRKAWSAGIVVVAAAGNDGGSGSGDLNKNPLYPACDNKGTSLKTLIAVGSVDVTDRLSPFSDYGSECMDLVAPGEDVYSTVVHDPSRKGYEQAWDGGFAGTSLSVAMVSGVAALLKSQDRQLTAAEIIGFIVGGADGIDARNPEYAGQLGAGRLNVEKSLGLLERHKRSAAQIVQNTAARLVWRGGKNLEAEFIRGDGTQPSSVAIKDVPAAAGWQIATGFWGARTAANVPLMALSSPFNDQVRVYDWSGTLVKAVSYGDRNAKGVQARLVQSGGTGEWLLAVMPRYGVPLVKWFDASGKRTDAWLAGPSARASWAMAAWSASGDAAARIAVMRQGDAKAGSGALFESDGELVANLSYQMPRNSRAALSLSFGRVGGVPSLMVVPQGKAPFYPLATYDLQGRLKKLTQLDAVVPSGGTGYFTLAKRDPGQPFDSLLVFSALPRVTGATSLDAKYKAVSRWKWYPDRKAARYVTYAL